MDGVERTIQHNVTKKEMHEAIDALGENDAAVLIFAARSSESFDYQSLGRTSVWEGMGLLQTGVECVRDILHNEEEDDE